MEQAQIVQNTTHLTTSNPKKSISSAILSIFSQKIYLRNILNFYKWYKTHE